MDRIVNALNDIYGKGDPRVEVARAGIVGLLGRYAGTITPCAGGWSQQDAFLITYGDSLIAEGEVPLQTLRRVLNERVGEAISFVHILPFCPFTSDDGFSVVDYRAINPALGDWPDVEDLAKERRLVADLVINHCSQESAYVQGYLANDPAYAEFCIAVDPATDLSQVVRPRTLPLLHDFTKADGETVHLWTTFSRDQVDLNFANPKVLIEFIDILLDYARHGSQMIRLDAIAFLWKEIGTSCLHLPQTHAAIRLIRAVYDAACPHVMLLSETNVPHQENIAYFGQPSGCEAQLIYNFSLSPLTLFALLAGDASALTTWGSQVTAVPNCTFLNMTATHDGIGMRPTEGLLDEDGRQLLCDTAHSHGGTVSYKTNSDGSQTPYELNINYFDAINDPNGDLSQAVQVARFLAAQSVLMSFIGVPSFYVHTLFGSRNWVEGWQQSDIPRRINRAQLQADDLAAELDDPSSLRHAVFNALTERLHLRSQQAAFHPDADQRMHDLGREVVCIERLGSGQRLFALINVTGTQLHIILPGEPSGHDLIADETIAGACELGPYQVRWIAID